MALEVNLSGETIWLNQTQMSILFERDRSVITKHLNNIFKSGELKEKGNEKRLQEHNTRLIELQKTVGLMQWVMAERERSLGIGFASDKGLNDFLTQ